MVAEHVRCREGARGCEFVLTPAKRIETATYTCLSLSRSTATLAYQALTRHRQDGVDSTATGSQVAIMVRIEELPSKGSERTNKVGPVALGQASVEYTVFS